MAFSRKISYLYAKNLSSDSISCGFVKVERRNQQIRLQLSLTKKVDGLLKDEDIFIIYEKNKNEKAMLYGEKIGVLHTQMHRPAFSCMIQDHTQVKLVGVSISDKITASFVTEEINWDTVIYQQEDEQQEESEDESLCEKATGEETETKITEDETSPENFVTEQSENISDMKATEVAVCEEQKYTFEEIFDNEGRTCNQYEMMKFWKIDRRDFGKLPAWVYHALDNSFATHAYMVHKHLIVGIRKEQNEELEFVGVPGFFYQQEKMIACMYGYPKFIPCKEPDSMEENFGYWIWFRPKTYETEGQI